MSDPNFVILYVDSPPASADFYAGLLGKSPVEASPTFAMFALETGVMLGLWSRHTVEPTAAAGSGEIAFTVGDADAVRTIHADWHRRGLPILQAPVDLDFGHTFVALDPDGHGCASSRRADREIAGSAPLARNNLHGARASRP